MPDKPIFQPSFGNRPDRIVGRDEVLSEVVEGLQDYPGSAGRAVFLMGQRGMGKTALLLEVAERSRELGYVAVRLTCGEAMLGNLIDMLQRAGSEFVKERRRPVRGFTAGALGFSVGLTFTEEAQRSFGFRVKLEMICERLAQAGKRVLVLVDEVDPSVEQMRSLATAYQELVGEGSDIAVVMAGLSAAVSGVLNYKTLTFLNRAHRISLGPVAIVEVETYYRSAFSRAGLVADSEIVKQAAAATEGFPYLIQLVGYHLVKCADPGEPVTATQLAAAREAAYSELDAKVLEAMLAPLSDVDVAFLKAMTLDDGVTKTSALGKRLGMSHGTVQTYRRRLLDAGVITAPRRGEVAFTLPRLAGYLGRR